MAPLAPKLSKISIFGHFRGRTISKIIALKIFGFPIKFHTRMIHFYKILVTGLRDQVQYSEGEYVNGVLNFAMPKAIRGRKWRFLMI